jgi:hypothetical protein
MKKNDDPNPENEVLWIGDRTAIYNNAVVILDNDSMDIFDEKDLEPITVLEYSVAPWGVDNDLPQQVMAKIDAAEIVGTNANFNWKVAYGQGPKLVEVIRDPETNRVKSFKEVLEGEPYDWYMRNNIPLVLMEILTDLSYFGNAFPVLIAGDKQPNGGRNGIKGIVHREAMFSRWGLDKKKLINRHLYCAKWDENPTKDEIQDSYVVDEYNAVADIQKRLLIGKDRRLCFPIYITSPGRPYYSYPNWWSIFRSGWYDQLTSIPSLKKAILKHNLGVSHIIYIADEYFKEKEELEKIPEKDHRSRKELYEDVVKQLCEQVVGEKNAGKAFVAKTKMVPTSSGGATYEKLLTVDTIKNDIAGGEYLTDYETGANIISYAMDVHPSLIGATPGKNSNSLSGSNIREIFIMKQSLSKPLAYLALQWWPVVRQINGWDKNLEIVIQDSLFTTLDQSKSGEIRTQNNVTQ